MSDTWLAKGARDLVNGDLQPEPISYDIYNHDADDPIEQPDFDGLDTQSVTKGL
jgi:hypothetical protein